MNNIKLCIFLLSAIFIQSKGETDLQDPVLSNLDEHCLYCLCLAPLSRCDLNYGCQGGYCGPYRISQIYWVDSGNVTLPGESPSGVNAYQNCTKDLKCSQRTIINYLSRWIRDCNGDGVTDCHDFSLMNANGKKNCETPLEDKRNGRAWLRRFHQCFPKRNIKQNLI